MPRPSLREAIVASATTQFHLHGYNGTGVAAITTAAGAPKGSFYNHFASKEQLALEVVDRFADGMGLEMLADAAMPPLERVRGHFAFLAGALEEHAFRRGCLLGNLAVETAVDGPEVAARVTRFFERWSLALAGAIRAAQADGSVPAHVDAEVVADELIDLYEGRTMRARTTAGPAGMQHLVDHALPRLLELPRA
jgi:TetR/AcrR family transcriptional repressor of nem operon